MRTKPRFNPYGALIMFCAMGSWQAPLSGLLAKPKFAWEFPLASHVLGYG